MRSAHLSVVVSAALVAAVTSAIGSAQPRAAPAATAPLLAAQRARPQQHPRDGVRVQLQHLAARTLARVIGNELTLRTRAGRQVCRISDAQFSGAPRTARAERRLRGPAAQPAAHGPRLIAPRERQRRLAGGAEPEPGPDAADARRPLGLRVLRSAAAFLASFALAVAAPAAAQTMPGMLSVNDGDPVRMTSAAAVRRTLARCAEASGCTSVMLETCDRLLFPPKMSAAASRYAPRLGPPGPE